MQRNIDPFAEVFKLHIQSGLGCNKKIVSNFSDICHIILAIVMHQNRLLNLQCLYLLSDNPLYKYKLSGQAGAIFTFSFTIVHAKAQEPLKLEG